MGGLGGEQLYILYVNSALLGVMTQLIMGFNYIQPSSRYEIEFQIVAFIICSFIYGYTLNQIGKIINDIYRDQSIQKQKLYDIMLYLDQRNINKGL